MPDEKSLFQIEGPTWSERAGLGELNAVISPTGSERTNRFYHGIHMFGARRAANLARRGGVILDFGFGTGRFVRFFASRGMRVVGTELTEAMAREAIRFGRSRDSLLILTNGFTIPLADESVDLVWCCGVLRFSLFVENPKYAEIAREFHRVLKPGGHVVNLEVYVDVLPDAFTADFENVGFTTDGVSVLQRYGGRIEKRCRSRRLPTSWMPLTGSLCAALRHRLDNAMRPGNDLRDYLFVWRKPKGTQ